DTSPPKRRKAGLGASDASRNSRGAPDEAGGEAARGGAAARFEVRSVVELVANVEKRFKAKAGLNTLAVVQELLSLAARSGSLDPSAWAREEVRPLGCGKRAEMLATFELNEFADPLSKITCTPTVLVAPRGNFYTQQKSMLQLEVLGLLDAQLSAIGAHGGAEADVALRRIIDAQKDLLFEATFKQAAARDRQPNVLEASCGRLTSP
ncbi:hypothetical protein M885DRAFT_579630, partial [Pelagophyceae sp. CCMP2097]